MTMIDVILLGGIRRGDENALGQLIDKYNAYVCAVIRNTVSMPEADIEETSSDVFFSLWENADKVQKLKQWLGATARNKARNKIRKFRDDLPLDDEIPAGYWNEPEDALINGSERDAVKAVILAMDAPDREIFLRHYYGSQTAAVIGEETGLSEAAVKMRLKRGRERLKPILCKEVFGE